MKVMMADTHESPLTISEAEWTVMELLWERAPRTSPEICKELGQTRAWKRTTVMTLLRRLIDKGAVKIEGQSRPWKYAPALERDRCVAKETRGFLDRLFQGALLPLVAHCLEHQKVSRNDLAALRDLLDEAERRESK
jgi:BlaI family penicillinase repressor